MTRATWALVGLPWILFGCDGDGTSSVDGARDAPRILSENTAAMCGDGQDNDGDGFADCADQDCWVLTFCAEERPDGWKPPTDGGPADSFHDAPYVGDGAISFDTGLQSCAIHFDCPQGEFCYKGKCLRDPKQAIYHCGKPGCPPGQWCLTQANAKERCPEDASYVCQDACDCGPAHCCLNNRCVRDLGDPWITVPVVGTSPPGKCQQGKDATYCCAAPSCHAGRFAYGSAVPAFRCANRTLGTAESFCGGKTCFGTACNCDPGESCVDTAAKSPVMGRTCLLLSGGACVSNAVAEAVYGYSPTDLVPCCGNGCFPGRKCEVGWRTDGEYAYARVVGVCGGACGNGTCDPGESDASCAMDCAMKCGDGQCVAQETNASCPQDCMLVADPCPDGPINPRLFRRCGDGICGGSGKCDEPETCRTCPQDCGKCEWIRIAGAPDPSYTRSTVTDIWGSSSSDVFAVGYHGTALRYDGTAWTVMPTGTSLPLNAVWGSSSSNVFAVGGNNSYDSTTGKHEDHPALLHFDGFVWKTVPVALPVILKDVWGSSAMDVFVVGTSGAVLHFDGTQWTSSSVPPLESGFSLTGIWGSSPTNVFATAGYYPGPGPLRGAILRFDGMQWNVIQSNLSSPPSHIWGSSSSDVFAAGGGAPIVHYDGQVWSPMDPGLPGTNHGIAAIWGSSKNDVFAVGRYLNPGAAYYDSAILHYEGGAWTYLSQGSITLRAVWGTSASDVFVGGYPSMIHYDGASWVFMQSQRSRKLNAVWTNAASDTYVVGECFDPAAANNRAEVIHWDGGQWTPTLLGSSASAIWAGSSTDVFVVGGQEVNRFDGKNWTSQTLTASYDLTGVWGASPTQVFAVGGTMGTSDAFFYDGQTWTQTASGLGVRLQSVWGTSENSVLAVGAFGSVVHYDGLAWTKSTVLGNGPLAAIWGRSATDVFALSGYDGSYHGSFHYNGASWTPMMGPGVDFSAVWGASGTDTFAVSRDGMIMRAQGNTWSILPEDFREEASAAYKCQALQSIHGSSATEIYAVGDNDAILQYCPNQNCPVRTLPPP